MSILLLGSTAFVIFQLQKKFRLNTIIVVEDINSLLSEKKSRFIEIKCLALGHATS